MRPPESACRPSAQQRTDPAETALRLGGIVLFGGRSTRMGAPKETLTWGGETMLERVVRTVWEAASPVVAVGRRGQPVPPLPGDTLVAFDAVDDCGPLAGVLAGMEALAGRCDAVFVAGCDQPRLRAAWIGELVKFMNHHPGVAVRHEGRLHPLTAVYRTDTRPILQQMLNAGQRRAERFVHRCGARIVESHLLRHVDPDLDSLLNINEPEAWKTFHRE